MRPVRPLRPDARFTLLVHPRWGEFFGGWTLADRMGTAADFADGSPEPRAFALEFHNPAPALLSAQVVGPVTAGIAVTRVTVEPLLPLSEFADRLARTYEDLALQ